MGTILKVVKRSCNLIFNVVSRHLLHQNLKKSGNSFGLEKMYVVTLAFNELNIVSHHLLHRNSCESNLEVGTVLVWRILMTLQ